VLIQLFPPDDERLSLETCRGGKINTLKKEKSASSWLKIHNRETVLQLFRCLFFLGANDKRKYFVDF
jgi:hypothetical protein